MFVVNEGIDAVDSDQGEENVRQVPCGVLIVRFGVGVHVGGAVADGDGGVGAAGVEGDVEYLGDLRGKEETGMVMVVMIPMVLMTVMRMMSLTTATMLMMTMMMRIMIVQMMLLLLLLIVMMITLTVMGWTTTTKAT